MDNSENASIGSDRLLSINEVCKMTGFCPIIASRLMNETGRCMTIHRRKFILESALLAYLQEKEGEAAC